MKLSWKFHCGMKVWMKVSWKFHESFIKLSWNFHSKMKVSWKFHNALKVSWKFHQTFIVPWKFHESFIKLSYHCETFMKVSWNFHESFMQTFIKLSPLYFQNQKNLRKSYQNINIFIEIYVENVQTWMFLVALKCTSVNCPSVNCPSLTLKWNPQWTVFEWTVPHWHSNETLTVICPSVNCPWHSSETISEAHSEHSSLQHFIKNCWKTNNAWKIVDTVFVSWWWLVFFPLRIAGQGSLQRFLHLRGLSLESCSF